MTDETISDRIHRVIGALTGIEFREPEDQDRAVLRRARCRYCRIEYSFMEGDGDWWSLPPAERRQMFIRNVIRHFSETQCPHWRQYEAVVASNPAILQIAGLLAFVGVPADAPPQLIPVDTLASLRSLLKATDDHLGQVLLSQRSLTPAQMLSANDLGHTAFAIRHRLECAGIRETKE